MSRVRRSDAPRTLIALVAIVLMLSGRAMTLAFLGSVGHRGTADPPLAWRTPLLGDAIIGLTAPLVAYLAFRGRSVAAWTIVIAWNVVGIWDALAAYVIHTTNPWPSFFMIETFGASMFFMASAMHAVCIWLATRAEVRDRFIPGI